MAQMKEQKKSLEKELNEMQIVNLSDGEFKTLVIRMLKELKYGKNIREEMKLTPSEIKKNLQGTNSGGDEFEKQINDLEHTEEKNIQSEHQRKKRTRKKMRID